MSASSIASSTSASTLQALFQQRRSDFKTMASDVQSGDMSGAQSALTALQQVAGTIQGLGGASAPPSTQQTGSLQSSFANLISSIQAGSTTGAQSALSTLQQTLQSASASATSGTSTTSATGSTQSSFVQELTSLIQAVQAGDQTAAQQDLTQLQSTLQTQSSGEAGGAHHHHHHGGTESALNNTSNASSSNSASSNGTSTTSVTNASTYASMMDMQATSSLMSAFA